MAESKQISYDRIYCYKNSTVLKNKKDLQDQGSLDPFERSYTFLRMAELKRKMPKSDLSFEYLKKIHKYIFQDVFDWAGKVRSVDIAKENMFCKAIFIESFASEIFLKLKQDNYLCDLGEDNFCTRLAVFYGDINALHPFREGNGRAQRLFVEELARRAKHPLDLTRISSEENLQASKMSFLCDYTRMEKIIKKAIRFGAFEKE